MNKLESDISSTEKVKNLGIPKHVAIIMDGNRRWARQRGLPVFQGHTRGADIITDIVRFASDVGIEVLTLYSFSTENWMRAKEEIEGLMHLIVLYLHKNLPFMLAESVRLETIGDIDKLPRFVQAALADTKAKTAGGKKIVLNLALNYGARDEIRRAVVRIVEDVQKGKLAKEAITEDCIAQYLDTAEIGDPDLFIRTSGEQRLSNFLLWQLSYTEVYITKTLWPDFTKEDLLDAVAEFQRRNRRLGGA